MYFIIGYISLTSFNQETLFDIYDMTIQESYLTSSGAASASDVL